MTAYYMIAFGDAEIGDAVAAEDAADHLITADPRRLQPSESLDDADCTAFIAPGQYRVAVLTPVGEVSVEERFALCEDGWTVTGIEPVDGILGPQAAQLRAAIATAEAQLMSDDVSDAEDAYDLAVNGQYRGAVWLPQSASDAAEKALADAGADGWWWANGFSCQYGPEMLALAARDLIDEATGWNQAAYDLLTALWNAAGLPPLHPDGSDA